jgi:hypothetical protein
MNVTEIKEALLLCREARITAFIWGKHGLGKSSAVAQLVETMGAGMVDMRCSQLEASDLRGLPDREITPDGMVGRTIYLPPADLPDATKCSPACSLFRKEGKKSQLCIDREANKEIGCQGILFLDELNRAEDDVLQAVFQLVWDKAIGTYKVPAGWSVVVAGNYMEGYTVNNFGDPAFLNRFCHLDLTLGESYMGDWSAYMKSVCGVNADKILQFVGYNDAHLAGKTESDRGFQVGPSPRSWEMVARVHNIASEQGFDRNIVQHVTAGLIGRELALQFERFTTEVLPSEVIADFGRVKDKVKKMATRTGGRNELIGLVWGVASNAKELGKAQGDEKKMNNVLDFMEIIAKTAERDMAVMLARTLCEGETKTLGGAVVSNPNLAKMAAKFKNKKGGVKSWIQAITERPEIQDLMSKVSYGS